MSKKTPAPLTKTGRMPLWEKLGIEARLPEIEEWYKQGALDKDVFDKLGVSKRTFENWKADNNALLSAIKRGIRAGLPVTNQMVVNASLRAAIGFEYTEKTVITYPDGRTRTTETTRFYPGTTGDRAYWLNNKLPAEWKTRQEVEVNIGQFKEVEEWTEEDKRKFIESGGKEEPRKE